MPKGNGAGYQSAAKSGRKKMAGTKKTPVNKYGKPT